jgi:hypothetical protein
MILPSGCGHGAKFTTGTHSAWLVAQADETANDLPEFLIVPFFLLIVGIIAGLIWFTSVRPLLRRREGLRELPNIALQRAWRFRAEADDELWAEAARFHLLHSASLPSWIPGLVRRRLQARSRHVVDATWGRQQVIRMFNFVYWERVYRGRGTYAVNRHHRGGAIVYVPQRVPHFWLEPRRRLTSDHVPQAPPSGWEKFKTGFDDFDRRFAVRSSRPEEARAVLVPPLMDALLALPYGRWEVSQDGKALLALARKPWELGDYERVPERLSSVAGALPRSSPSSERHGNASPPAPAPGL